MSTRAFLDDPLQSSSPNTVERLQAVVAIGTDVIGCGSNLNRTTSSETAFCLRLNSEGNRVTSWGVNGVLNMSALGDANESNIFSSVLFDAATDRLILSGQSKLSGSPVFQILLCIASASSGNIINCSRTVPSTEKEVRRAGILSNGALIVVEISDGPSLFVLEYDSINLTLNRVVFQLAAVHKFPFLDMVLAGGMIHLSYYTLPSLTCQFLSILPNGTSSAIQLPGHPDGCLVNSMALDDMNRIVLGGTWGNTNFSSPFNDIVLWRINISALGSFPQLDTTFGSSGVLKINNTHGATVFVTRLVYDQAFRLVVFGRVLRNRTTNDNDILVYRRYSRDGLKKWMFLLFSLFIFLQKKRIC